MTLKGTIRWIMAQVAMKWTCIEPCSIALHVASIAGWKRSDKQEPAGFTLKHFLDTTSYLGYGRLGLDNR
jgi:hypothetical protein